MAEHVWDVGVVAIGRNEGERLRRCFDALPAGLREVVYVDSASTDESVEEARRRGIEVVALDMSVPFTAARARNAGLRRLREQWPDLRFVQFIDGDCTLHPDWLHAAVQEIEADPALAMVCGRRRELHPDASVYNRLCDMEWDTPVGEVESTGGDALARQDAVLGAGGYDEGLIAGEEPELCARLRSSGWKIRRIDREMTLHDAGMLRFSQWWRRSVRAGHAFAEVSAMHRGAFRGETLSIVAWGLVVPAAALVTAPFTHGTGVLLLLGFPVLWMRILARRLARGDILPDAFLYASACTLGKFPEFAGAVRFWWNRACQRKTDLIEYR